jgi:chorismate mutase
MESAVNSLNTYLEAAREETDEQNEQFGALVKERILLTQRIKELEQLNEMVPRQTAEITHLREVK